MSKNGKTISIVLTIILLFSGFSIVSAPPGTPYAVQGRVVDAITGAGVEGASVTVSNVSTGETGSTFTTNSLGFWGGDGALPNGGEDGNVIRAVATKGSGYGEGTGTYGGAGTNINITMVFPLSVSLSIDQDQCAGTATATANSTGGDGNYSYSWSVSGGASQTSGGSSSDNTISIAGTGVSGSVSVTVSDGTGSDSSSVSYEFYDDLTSSGSTSVDCDDLGLTININGGNPPYQYEFDYDGNGTADRTGSTSSSSVSETFNPGWGTSGSWKWKVTDACQSTSSGSASWTINGQVSVTLSGSQDQCSGEVSVTASASGGNGSYQYEWDSDGNGSYETSGQSSRTFSKDYGTSGTIGVRVSDGCSSATDSYSYSINDELVVNITNAQYNCAYTTVTFTAQASGGSGGYEYAWDSDNDGYDDGSGTSFTFTPGINKSGTVKVRVTDSSDCTATDSEGYNTTYTGLTASGSWDWNCDGNLVLTVGASGGTPGYTYEIDADNNGSFDYSTTTSNSSVQYVFNSSWGTCGQWKWKVTDNCDETITSGSSAWEIPAALSIQWASVDEDHCNGTVTFTAQASGGSANYRYDWDMDGNGSYEVTNGGSVQTLAGYGISGNVNARVTDTSHGCTDTIRQSYSVNPELQVNVSVAVDHCAGVATFTAAATGGSGPGTYTYDWDLDDNGTYEVTNGGTQQAVSGIGIDGNVNVRVNDEYCTDFGSKHYSINPPLSLSLNVTYGDGVANFLAEGHGGGESYTYDWDMDNDGTFEILNGGQSQKLNGYGNQGTVSARVKDLCQDQANASVSYSIPEEVIQEPPSNIFSKGIFNLDGESPHSGSPSYLVMWYPSELTENYTLQESTDKNFNVIVDEYITFGTQKKYTNKMEGTYYYRVKGCNEAGCTQWSDTMVATVGTEIVLSDPVTSLQAEADSETSISLSWSDNSDNEAGFRLYRNGSEIADLSPNTTSYLDEGLECGTSYTYFVRVYNSNGNSPASNIVTGATMDCKEAPGKPNSPTDVGARTISVSKVELTWTDQSDNETGFKVCRDGNLIAELPADTTVFMDTGLECGISYTYFVFAYNEYGQSVESNSALATTKQCQQQTTTPEPGSPYVTAELFSPAYLHALDAQGRHIGRIDSENIEVNIPGGDYSGIDSHPQIITVHNPQSEIQFYFEAYEDGIVTLNVESNENGKTEKYSFEDLNVQNGSVFLVNASSNTGQLDIDGDGVYEQEISGILVQDDDGGKNSNIMYVALIAVIIFIALAGFYLNSKRE